MYNLRLRFKVRWFLSKCCVAQLQFVLATHYPSWSLSLPRPPLASPSLGWCRRIRMGVGPEAAPHTHHNSHTEEVNTEATEELWKQPVWWNRKVPWINFYSNLRTAKCWIFISRTPSDKWYCTKLTFYGTLLQFLRCNLWCRLSCGNARKWQPSGQVEASLGRSLSCQTQVLWSVCQPGTA